jgi:hypothetical protein
MLPGSDSVFCASSAPTLVGRLEAMLAKMSTLVPLPSFSSLMVSVCVGGGMIGEAAGSRQHRMKSAGCQGVCRLLPAQCDTCFCLLGVA